MQIRTEQPEDGDAIRQLTTMAFAAAEHSSGTEADIVESLRQADALTLSLVADSPAGLLGHVAFSPVLIDGRPCGWYGLGPLSVAPAEQGSGIGSALVRAGLDRLRQLGGQGCVVLGDPGYYGRFGFRPDAGLLLEGVPPVYFQCLPLQGTPLQRGVVTYHPAFFPAEPG